MINQRYYCMWHAIHKDNTGLLLSEEIDYYFYIEFEGCHALPAICNTAVYNDIPSGYEP